MLALALCLTLAAPGIDSAEYKEQLSEGVHRHDARDYEGAMSVYRAMLETWPHDPEVVYELALSMQGAGKEPAEVVAFVEGELKEMKKPLGSLYSMLGAYADARGALVEGEAWFRKAVAATPKSAAHHFNLGINLAMQEKNVEAEKELLSCATSQPDHPGAWRSLSILTTTSGRLGDALTAKMRFVVLEPDSDRGQMGARSVEDLMRRVVAIDGKNMEVRVSAPGDLEIALLVGAASVKTEDESERFVESMRSIIGFAAEDKKATVRRAAASLFMEAKKAGVLDAALWELRRAASDPRAATWFSKHRKESEAFDAFIKPHRKAARGASAF
jgi:tetratricopeptide (TPR) repeat protein